MRAGCTCPGDPQVMTLEDMPPMVWKVRRPGDGWRRGGKWVECAVSAGLGACFTYQHALVGVLALPRSDS